MNADWEAKLREAITLAQRETESVTDNEYADGFSDGMLFGYERSFLLITGKEYRA